MIRKASAAAAVIGGLLSLLSCQAVFTYSPVAFLERDLATLSDEQQVERARDALESGSSEDILDAYAAITEIIAAGGAGDTPENNLLAADLAFSGSGVIDVLGGVVQNLDVLSSATEEEINALFTSFDATMVDEGAAYVQAAAADPSAEITESQYLIAGASLLASAAEQATNGFEIISTPPSSGEPGYDEYQEAISFLSSGGIDDLSSLFSF